MPRHRAKPTQRAEASDEARETSLASSPATPLPSPSDSLLDLAIEARTYFRAIVAARHESPIVRLPRVRAALDRLEGIREQVSIENVYRATRAARAEESVKQALADAASTHGNGYLSRGFAADERLALYALKYRTAEGARATAVREAETARLLERDIRDMIKWAEGHRLEALTLLRGEVTIAAEEYNV